MNPKTFADQMRQARLRSPLRTREQALKQFAEVEGYLQRQHLLPKSKPSDALPKAETSSAPWILGSSPRGILRSPQSKE